MCCFQAFRDHKLHDPLCEPGTADLTADVDFSYLKSLVSDQGLSCVVTLSWAHIELPCKCCHGSANIMCSLCILQFSVILLCGDHTGPNELPFVFCIQYNTIQYNTIQYNTIQYNTIQYNTIQYNTIQYNTIQYNNL